MDIGGARGRAARIASALRRARTGPAMRELTGELSAAMRARPGRPSGVRDVCRALCEEMSARRGGRPVEVRFERFPDEIEVTGLWVEFQDFDLVIVEERAEAVQQLVILGHELWHLHAGHRHHHHGIGPMAANALARHSGPLKGAGERAERAGPGEGTDAGDWAPGGERSGRGERAEQSGRGERAGRGEWAGLGEQAERADPGERGERVERADAGDWPQGGEWAGPGERAERAGPGGRAGSGAWGGASGRVGWGGVALGVAARSGSREDDEAEADDFGHRLANRFRRYLTDSGPAGETAAIQRTLGYRGRRSSAR